MTKRIPRAEFEAGRPRSAEARRTLARFGLEELLGRSAVGSNPGRSLIRTRDADVLIPSLVLHAPHGEVVIANVITLRADGTWEGMPGAALDGALLGAPSEIASPSPAKKGSAVLVMGVLESLAAAAAFPDSVIVGAIDERHYELFAGVVARRVRLAGGVLRVVVPDSDLGEQAAVDAVNESKRIGLRLGETVRIVDPGNNSLAAAWAAGWRDPVSASRKVSR